MNLATHETPDHRLDRQAAYFRELSDLNMDAARTAAKGIAAAQTADADTHKPTLDLSRATRGVVDSVNAENRLFVVKKLSEPPPRARRDDTRRAPLHQALHLAAKNEPDPTARAALGRQINAAIEQTLLEDPDGEISLTDHFVALLEEFQLQVDPAKLSDEILGIPPRVYDRPGSTGTGSADTGDPT